MSRRKPTCQPCSDCGRVPRNPRLDYCPVCRANAAVAFYLALERSQDEQRKAFHLYRLRAVLIGAGRYLNKSEVETIRHVINEAIKRPLRYEHNREENKIESTRGE
jgi:hypothetical protein